MSKQNQNNQNQIPESGVENTVFFENTPPRNSQKLFNFRETLDPVYDFDYSVNIFFDKYILIYIPN